LILAEQHATIKKNKTRRTKIGRAQLHKLEVCIAFSEGERKECSEMAIYYAKVNIISRGKGRSAVAAAAYRSGERIRNNYDGVLHNYTRKSGVVYAQILLPKNAPSRFADRGTLWNEVEAGERKNGRLAREVVLALPREFGQEEQKAAVAEYCQTFTGMGMIADYAIHDKGDGNPHAHIMLTDRPLTTDGFAKKKNRDWNKDELIEEWRAAWAEICNRRLPQQERIDHRSYERRGYKGFSAYVHEGVAARQIEQRGGVSYRCEMNRRIRADRSETGRAVVELQQLIEAKKQKEQQRSAAEAARLKALEEEEQKKIAAQNALEVRIRRLESEVIVQYGIEDKNAYRGILDSEKADLEKADEEIAAEKANIVELGEKSRVATEEAERVQREIDELNQAWFGVKKYFATFELNPDEVRENAEQAKKELQEAESKLSAAERRRAVICRNIADRQENERLRRGIEATKENARERLSLQYWKYDLTEQIFLSERDTILAEKGRWSMSDTIEVAKNMLKMGETEDRVAAAIQKHAPELSRLSEQQRKASVKSIMLRAADRPQQSKKRTIHMSRDNGRGRGGR
jgi:hypothetical protein